MSREPVSAEIRTARVGEPDRKAPTEVDHLKT